MHYYQFNIADFNNSTRHLTRVERMFYRDMIDLYYDKEKPLPADMDQLYRRVLAHAEDEKAAVCNILADFFTLEDDGYHNHRCDSELAKYAEKSEAKSRAGKASAAKRKKNSVRVQQVLDTCSTGEQLTNNQEPITNKEKKQKKTQRKAQLPPPEDVDSQVWEDFLAIRKAKRCPITETALTNIRRECGKAGIDLDQALRICCTRGWAAFKASWEWQDKGKEESGGFQDMLLEVVQERTQV